MPRLDRTDLELAGRLKNLAWLPSPTLAKLVASMSVRDVKRNDVLFTDVGAPSSDVFILLSGAARIRHAATNRVVAIVGPGMMFRIPTLPPQMRHRFRYEAFSDCRIGWLPLAAFIEIAGEGQAANVVRMVNEMTGALGQLLARYPTFHGLDRRTRLAIALLELGEHFGVQNARGALLRISPTHEDLADLIGASRPKITQTLYELERLRLITREGRRIILLTNRLREFVATGNAD